MFYHTLIAPDEPLLKDNNMFNYVIFIELPSLFNVPFFIPLSRYKPTNQSQSSSESSQSWLISKSRPLKPFPISFAFSLNRIPHSISSILYPFSESNNLLWCKIHTNHFLASTNTPNYLILSFFHSNSSSSSSFSFFPSSSFSSSSTSS